ncbi:carbamoyl-phosphate synthase (glutamine-hydrolyzing) cpa2 [Lobulomyces angularis]|nr:carbamoyl-phosphate synthase (glutamine-hydrolyzing) cpa2 [Lobulomyces angularis]
MSFKFNFLAVLFILLNLTLSVNFKLHLNRDINKLFNYLKNHHAQRNSFKHYNFDSKNDYQKVRFDHHQVWRLHWNDFNVYESLNAAFENVKQNYENLVDIWTVNQELGYSDVRVSPSAMSFVTSILKPLQIVPIVQVENIQTLIDVQEDSSSLSNEWDNAGGSNFHKSYHRLSEINEFLDEKVKNFKGRAQKVLVGYSYEKREINGIRISGTTKNRKREIIFHGAIHSREWIGAASVLYIADQLLSLYGKDDLVTKLLNIYDWIIIPVLNVDGYEYTHTNNRMWRKTRQPNGGLFGCIGTDPNRNWDYEWSKPGASSSPCSEAYYGKAPFSAIEPKLMSEFIYNRREDVEIYIDVHAFSQLWMYPYGARCDKKVPEEKKILKAAQDGASALKKIHGTNFKVGGICKTIYQASGNSVDWVYARANVTYSYAIELRDTGRYGFLLPPDQIIPSGEELFSGLTGLAETVATQEKRW